MEVSENGINFIKYFEGCSLKAYKNKGEKYYTIGYGHYGDDVYCGQTITQEQAENMLINDIKTDYVPYIEKYKNDGIINFELTQNMIDALTSFAYNNGVGEGGLKTLVNGRDSKTVAEKMLLYYHSCSPIYEQGLKDRRKAERQLFLTGGSIPFSNESNESCYEEHGNAEVLVNCLNVRTSPSLSGEVVANYYKGEVIYNYDRVYNADGYRWIRYLGGSGEYRFVAVRDLSDMHKLCNCY